MWRIIHIPETDSTNRYLHELGGKDDVCVWADYQTAGRGCGTNTWESEQGKNLLFSLLIHPANVPATDQFILSMANALALKDALADYVDDIMIKWPNDIYWHDRKLGGTLIETTLQGSRIKDCIIGTGLNVNQDAFRSDAPNPVSLMQILKHEVHRSELLQQVVDNMTKYMAMVDNGSWSTIRTLYRNHLYRLEETHDYRFTDGSVKSCKLVGVTDDGRLQLLLPEEQGGGHSIATFAFKEVQFIL